jgi:Tol biopolymer transport system component
MPLAIGDKLGHYEVLSLLGQGGMGEVYRAHDATLKRYVALKVLPATFFHDHERMARFQREAEVLASLDHPNIGHIYGIVDSGDSRGLVLALIDGPTLGDRIQAGSIPVGEAVAIAKQIIEALEYAHDRGVVHRDLKPANIKITFDGVVKVLDFGLAKVLEQEAPASLLANSPTLTLGHTRAGVILGTAAYMSPEQAVGRPVDRRSDIFSFGAVLFEMLTGKRAFAGPTVPDVLETVVKNDPNWSALPLATPAYLRNLLQRTLTKDRKQRLQAIGEARIALEHPPDFEPTSPVGPRLSRLAAWLAAVAAIAVAAAGWFYLRQPAPASPPTLAATLLPPEGQDFEFAQFALPALSPDGSRIVFPARTKAGRRQLYVRRLDSTSAQVLAGTEGAIYPFWSSDGRWIGFGQGSKLMKFDLQGSAPVPVANLPASFEGGTWNSEGVILFGVGAPGKPLYRVAAGGGAPVPATTLDSDTVSSHVQPWFLPDRKHFLYTTYQNADIPVRVGSLDEPGKAGKVVAKCESNAVYAQGYLICARGVTLFAQLFDLNRLATSGDAVPLAQSVSGYAINTRTAAFSVSTAGLLTYQALVREQIMPRVVWRDREGKQLRELPAAKGSVEGMNFSPDGKRLAVHIWDYAQSSMDVWAYDLARGVPTRLTFDPAQDFEPVWTPDGKTIYFRSTRLGGNDIYKIPANGVGQEELVFRDPRTKEPEAVSPDGKTLLFTSGSEIWSLDVTDPMHSHPFGPIPKATAGSNNWPKFSSDGKWIAYASDESGRMEVYAVATSSQGGKRQISAEGGTKPRWRRDGKEIYFLHGRDLMVAEVSVRDGVLEVGQQRKLFGGIVDCCGMMYDVTPDGQKFVAVEGEDLGGGPLTLVQNWVGLLRP